MHQFSWRAMAHAATGPRRWLALLACALIALVSGGLLASPPANASPAQHTQSVQGQTFTVATDTTWAPFEFDKGGELRGIDMDLIRAIAKDQGFNIQIQPIGFDGALQAVQANQADMVIAGMSITDERKKTFDFSNPYFDSGVQMAVSSANPEVKTYKDLKGKVVAVKSGTESFDFATELSKQYGFEVRGFQDTADVYNDLSTGNSAAIFDDYPIIAYAKQTGQVQVDIVTPQERGSSYGIAVNKGQNDALLAAINEGLKNVTASGEYDKILKEYLGDQAPEAAKIGHGSIMLANQQIVDNGPGTLPENPMFPVDTPKDKGTFVIATDTTFAPFEFQQDGKNVGIDMDLLQAIAANQGFEVEVKPLGFDAALQAVQSGQADGIIAGMSITDERKKVFDFSDPYFEAGVQMAVSAKNEDITGYEDLAGKAVAVKTGTEGARFAESIKDQYGFEIHQFADSADMYNDVTAGGAVAAFEDAPVLQYGIKEGLELKTVTDPEKGGELGFAVNKGENAELLRMFNDGLAAAKDTGVYDLILDRYLKAEDKTDNSFFGLVAAAMPMLLQGLLYTLIATALSLVFGMLLGIFFGFLKISKSRILRVLATIYVDIFRGTPVLVQAFFFYFGLPAVTGVQFDALTAGVLTLSLNSGAYITETVRSGIQSVDPGQMEASRSLGLGWGKSMQKVVLPQAFKIMTPSLINQFIITLKDTSLLSVLGLAELTYQGRVIIASTFRSFEIWILVAAVYFVVIWLLTALSNYADRKLNK
ncbi:ABC transporter substrate-binding protein/permease [Pseudoclavibacter alba]|uniref:ABC transporter substrate-binding protein/permease n=1 Tax=Pseudoclavibacter albus TaxID=272241 RepID=A0ABT2HXX4_9MICO|nr:ABC transporter substrate-binding protein/permease [Pseudoclavibacter alba]MCT2043176.1 ABC transporter substrate-binding protein/permease [Pseudoclavibacter alba]